MLPRNNLFFPIGRVMILSMTLAIILTLPMVIAPANARGQGVKSQKDSTQSHPVMEFYNRYISPVDGNRCPMYPTCSAYTQEAVERHGLFMGWIMACDRLVRCGRDETRISPAIVINKSRVTLDPVSANDFWWYKKP
ncbi:conserved hypothetical protein [Desulforapulum autotrophicum HRM2]|uniref:Membrane protein insertion efficiency factor n=1 Tax=Desulforapulum autotrophicum (strain ATCC 43914 / DSM 3382 / VKM B-1955 / HRM2) TaxID=177437 RepID=C0QLT5_DESAH|nr:membrane protein insertion efficiency factor YidD [Desulforapulum autotrophicum]ACN14241.1 conserved hypothetical protein [Desulforapulum autotrophicum HRM2]